MISTCSLSKNLFFLSLIFAIILYTINVKAQQPHALPQLGKAPVSQVIKAMTLEEKAALIVGMQNAIPNQPAAHKFSVTIPVQGAAGQSNAIPRLGIPSIIFADGSSGLRIKAIRDNDSSKTYYTTKFPSGTLIASTWDTAMLRKVGAALGDEAHRYGVDVLLAPAINIQRNPLGGRNYEYYAEDPLLAGKLAAAMIKGIQFSQVGASLKHFAANNQENNRKTVDVIASERTLREMYLRGFEIAINESHPWTVMSSYNKLNGVYAPQNSDLLIHVLRDEWHFKGAVMSDWFGGDNPVEQVKAENDLIMPGSTPQSQVIVNAVNNNLLDVNLLDRNVADILELILKTSHFKRYHYNNAPDLAAHAQLARQAAAEGMVLLRDTANALPLKSKEKLAVFGRAGYELTGDPTTNARGSEKYQSSVLQGLRVAGYLTDDALVTIYEKYRQATTAKAGAHNAISMPVADLSLPADQIQEAADKNDAAIFCIGRTSSKGTDRQRMDDFELSAIEKQQLQTISDSFHKKGKKVIVLLNVAGVIETASWRNKADGIILMWQPGAEAGAAVADLLSGKINPSGKLTSTFPVNYADEPSAKNFPGNQAAIYEEGIYVGYRYFNTFKVPVAYEFGYGLSYTTFNYSHIKVEKTISNQINISVDIKNTGTVAGRDVAEVYIHAPAGNLDKPESELKAFAKTKLLLPNETQRVTFTVKYTDLASYDTQAATWVTAPGLYTIKVGSSALKINQSAQFNITRAIVTPVKHVLTPVQPVNELKRAEE